MKAKIKNFDELISKENLFHAFFNFQFGKKSKEDVQEFTMNLGKEIDHLHFELKNKIYKHGKYKHFVVNDPKKRDIHKASIRDRVLHHAMYSALYRYFDRKFVFDSYSCRIGKGTHRATERFNLFVQRCSQDYQKTVYVLQCDIKKFFASIDHAILFEILRKNLKDKDVLWLLDEIVSSFCTSGHAGTGLPLGNLTSQLLVNVYMNEFDQYVKHKIKVKYYIRYADDFVFMSTEKDTLVSLKRRVQEFLIEHLKLTVHPGKVSIRKVHQGVDFLGWVHFEHYRVLRTSTKRRMERNTRDHRSSEKIASYRGLLLHGNAHKIALQHGIIKP